MIAGAVRWAEQIMREVDARWPQTTGAKHEKQKGN
jgi:hypothetical protein